MSMSLKSTNILKNIILGCILLSLTYSCENETVELTTVFIDTDNDGIEESVDNCPSIANPDQADADGDGIGNLCDSDFDDSNVPMAICENGFAGIYPCNDYDLMAHVPIATFGAVSGNDSWGWTDPTTGNEYVLVATNTNVAFIDITEPTNPIYLGNIPTETVNSSWRDVKVYNDHAFIVADNVGPHGMQVFDLTRLRNVANPPETFSADAVYTGVNSCHNIVINEEEGFAYLVGCNTFSGGPNFIDITNPKNPVGAGGYAADGYSHDAQVITYNGPDTDYTGKQIYIGSNGSSSGTNKVVIIDVSDKANPQFISNVTYSNPGYTHQGWFTENQQHFILGDELDEQFFGNNTKTLVFDFSDLDNPILSSTYFGPTLAIDHNGYVKGNTYYLANYRAGLRVLDITNIAASSNAMTEVGFFDTHPSSDSANFNGVWNVYPYFESGNIVISDIEGGLFIVRKSGT
ncbi:choice-of-anchor B family protein [Hwangdonia seohaensis]|uniref:Choice-of-anchor B family protein n=1 Tax=Hwangdonia seohaensis TaxID=1240727 RepID=A0ABW3R900_9FLAO|nr:choice-of-anchor B family protein [Hwangdonia seohaensis]